MNFSVRIERPNAEELAALFSAVGWGGSSLDALRRSIEAYPCTVCARLQAGTLVGYLSAFSDGVMSTMLGELVVHPEERRRGVASQLLRVVEESYPDAPIYIKALGESKLLYSSLGFKQSAEMTVMFKRPNSKRSATGQEPARAA